MSAVVSAPHFEPLDIHTRRAVRADGTVALRQLVHCPARQTWTSLEACRHCQDCVHLSTPRDWEDSVVVCSASVRRGREDGTRHRLATLAHEGVAAAMDDRALTVEGTTPVAVLTRVLETEGEDGAVVVDAHDLPIGGVTWRDLRVEDASVPVQSVMSEPAVTLLERATVADALLLVGGKRQTRVPVLSSGRLLGVLTPRGLLAWLTARWRAAERAAASISRSRMREGDVP